MSEPTEEQIKNYCENIRSSWSDEELEKRAKIPPIKPQPTQWPMKEIYFIKPNYKDPRLDSFLNPYKLMNISRVAPESYSVFKDNVIVGHFTLRDGIFVAWYIKETEFIEIVYESNVGERWGAFLPGMFVSDEQRFSQLTSAVNALDKHILEIKT